MCRGTAGQPGGMTPGHCLSRQVLYQKSMQALDLLLQTFISENKSMDEMCFLLQVRVGVPRGAEWPPCAP